MYEIKFNHDAPNIPELIGITIARSDEIIERIDEADKQTETHNVFMEEAIRLADPKNEAELYFVGYAVGRIMQRKSSARKRAALERLLSGF